MKRRSMLAASLVAALPSRHAGAEAARPHGLVGTHGGRFELTQLRRGVSLLTFGFTRCTSTCPMSLAQAAGALRRLPDVAARIVFVTLDPLSDDATTLGRFLARFDSRILGVTGDPARVGELSEQLRVSVRGQGAELEHSSVWYLIDAQLRVRRTLPAHSSSIELADALRSPLETSP